MLIAGLPFTSFARSCDSNGQDKAEYFAEIAGNEIVDKFGGGQDIRVKVTSCDYNSYSELFKVEIEVYWSGAIFRSNKYNIDGMLKMKSDGTDTDFSQTYANERVKNLRFFRNLVGGAIVLGALAASE